MKQIRRGLCLILTIALLSQSLIVFATNKAPLPFEIIKTEYYEDGSLYKDIAKIGDTYLYKVNTPGSSVAFQITEKDSYSITVTEGNASYHDEGNIPGIYDTIKKDHIVALDNIYSQAVTRNDVFSFKPIAQQIVTEAPVVLASGGVDSDIITHCNNVWGGESTQYIAGGGKYIDNIRYTYSIYRSNYRIFGTEYQIPIGAGTAIDAIDFFNELPWSIVASAITLIFDGGLYKTAKDFLAKKMDVDNVGTKLVYVNSNNSHSYWSGWDSGLLFVHGDVGWVPNANFSYSVMHPDYQDNSLLGEIAIQNYIAYG